VSYVDHNLLPGETVTYRGRLHWIVYHRALVLVALGLLLLYPWTPNLPKLWIFGGVAVAVGVLAAIPAWLARWSTELVVTNKRIVAKRGLIRRDTVEMLHKKVESIAVHQSILGRLLGYGTLAIHGTGGGVEWVPQVARPLAFRNAALAASDDQAGAA
jgi:uncharacterized membrane protein YdbT with pleckstrin-like domain